MTTSETPSTTARADRPIATVAACNPSTQVPSELRLAGLSVVLPCLDEAANIAHAVAEAIAAGGRCAWAVEVVVVDDGSHDTTRRDAERLAALDSRVRVVAHDRNRGYGAALRTGIETSRMPWILLTDADLQFDLQQLVSMLVAARDHDLVAGYRIARQDPWPRRAAAWTWNRLMRRTFDVPVRDVDCAFKLVRGSALRALELRSEGAMISTELCTRAQRDGWRICEIGVQHRPRQAGHATGADTAVVLRAFAERRALARALAAAEAAQGSRRVRRVPRPREGTIGS